MHIEMLPALDVVLIAVALLEDERDLDNAREAGRRHGRAEDGVDESRAVDVLMMSAKRKAGHNKAGIRRWDQVSLSRQQTIVDSKDD
jgi:hypothetical protein